jgi:hypothetical protein
MKEGLPLVAWTTVAADATLAIRLNHKADSSSRLNGEKPEQDEQRRPKWG